MIFLKIISDILYPVIAFILKSKTRRGTVFLNENEKVKLIVTPNTKQEELEEVAKKLDIENISLIFKNTTFRNNGEIKYLSLLLERKSANNKDFHCRLEIPVLFLLLYDMGFQINKIPQAGKHVIIGKL